MERRTLGRSGIDVGIVGMGTWRTFDVPIGDDHAIDVRTKVVDRAVAAGIDLFDSSPMYGWAEEVLGRALGDRRDDVRVATKVWSSDIAEGRHQIERSLKFFGGRVDVFQVHNLVGWERYLPILRQRREEGDVTAIGVTHYAHTAFPHIMRIMETEAIDCIQIPYNAADSIAAREVLPLAAETGTGVIVMSPFGTGDLLRTEPPEGELTTLRLYGITTWAQALLKWVLADPRVTTTIPATSRPERAAENATAGEPPLLPEDERERVAWLTQRLVR